MVVGAGCKKTYNDTVGGKTADQRITEVLAAYQKKLTGSQYGWILVESTTGIAYNQGVSQTGPKLVLAYYMQFVDSNNVLMYSDFDTSMASKSKTSGYRIKALTRPALIFDTYSYLHVPCDPDPVISKSPFGYGYGWGTDFEYSFADTLMPPDDGDTIRLLGNLNGASGLLIRATQAQHDAYLQGKLKDEILALDKINSILNYFKRLSIGGVNYDIRLNTTDKSITFTWVDGSGNVQSQTITYFVTASGIFFSTPFVNGNQTIGSIENITSAGSTVNVTINGQQGTIVGAISPVKVDVNAPRRWWNYSRDNGYFWASWQGFHVNGVDDAFGVTSLSNASGDFYYYAYWASYFTNPADLFIPIMVSGNSLAFNSYASVPNAPPTFTSGKAIFIELGTAGSDPIPPGGPVDQTNQVLYNPAGYYLIQTGDKSYDMVLATDAKTWISWFWPL